MTGDQANIVARLRAMLPTGWFGDSTPVLDAVLNGMAAALSFIYSLLVYASLQTRISTATDDWLDLVAYDFYGDALTRNSNESDGAFRARIQAGLFTRKAGTKQAVIAAIEALPATVESVVEFQQPGDTSAYNLPRFAYSSGCIYGSRTRGWQALITVNYGGPAQDVYDAINRTKVLGTAVYVKID